MITTLEIAYVLGPVLFLVLGVMAVCGPKRWRLWLMGAMLCVVPIWSLSVYKMANIYRLLDSAWYGQERELMGRLGQPSIRVVMTEGDEYIIYQIRVQPWRIIAVYNVYHGAMLSVTHAEDFSAALDAIKSRSVKESRLVKSNLERMDRRNEPTGQP